MQFGLYGTGWLVSAAMSGVRWLRVVAYGSFALALAIPAASGRMLIASCLETAVLDEFLAAPD